MSEVREIQLGGHKKTAKNLGFIAVVDDDDYERISKYKWSLSIRKTRMYAMRSEGPRGNNKKYYMHREIINIEEGMDVDHINGNGLDNRKENLRVVSRQDNLRNMRNIRGGSSKYKGVYLYSERLRKPWMAMIRINKRGKYLGYYKTEEEAALAYNKAAIEHFGEMAKLNDV